MGVPASIVLALSVASCSLFNAGTVHVKYLRSKRADIDGRSYENVEKFKDVSASIRSVQHPRARDRWNFNVGLRPSIHYDDISYLAVGRPSSSLDFHRFSLLGNLRFTLHSPAGAFVLSAGYGGAVYRLEDGSFLDTVRTDELGKIDLVWVGFLTKRFFILLGPRYYKDDNEQYYFAFRLGYFWGRINGS